jgi:hypothetical protein
VRFDFRPKTPNLKRKRKEKNLIQDLWKNISLIYLVGGEERGVGERATLKTSYNKWEKKNKG